MHFTRFSHCEESPTRKEKRKKKKKRKSKKNEKKNDNQLVPRQKSKVISASTRWGAPAKLSKGVRACYIAVERGARNVGKE